MGKKLIFTALLLSLSVAALSQERVTEARSDLEKNLFTLASDEMLGRGAGTEQGAAAAAYIVSRFGEAGLYPGAADGSGRTFLQRFERSSGRRVPCSAR